MFFYSKIFIFFNLHFQERVPLYAPNICPENQLLYPGYQEHDWVCDCGPSKYLHCEI